MQYLPEKVGPAEQFSFPREALIGERSMAVETPYALGMPCPLQDVQQELIQDWFVAARAGYQHSGGWLAPTCERKELHFINRTATANYQ